MSSRRSFLLLSRFLLMATASLPTFLTVDELAAVLRCQPEKVYRLAARGELPSYKVEGRRLFNEAEVIRWLECATSGLPSKQTEGGGHGLDPFLQTANGERRYEVRYRDRHGRQRSRAFSVRKDAQAFKLDVERRRQAGLLYQASPETFSSVARAWLERYTIGAAGRVRPRPDR